MSRSVSPLTVAELPELSRFLTTGFHVAPDADFASIDVLRWKYLDPNAFTETKPADPLGRDAPRSYVARDHTGQIIGHLGLCRTTFEGESLSHHSGRVSTIHIIDWLGSVDHRAVGISLMRKAHEGTATQFGLGVSQAALVVGERAGYELRGSVPVYTRTLRPSHWLRTTSLGHLQRALHLARDTVLQAVRRPAKPRIMLSVIRVSEFGPEIDPIVEQAKAHAILTERTPARLNTMLRFPRQTITGWHILDPVGQLCGFALLNVVPSDTGKVRTGKVIDCLLDGIDLSRWQAGMVALTQVLRDQGADVAMAYASNPWTAAALRQSGFKSRFAVKFHIRDRNRLIPPKAVFHLTPLEGDYAYT
jgi:hypothetical protein